MNDLGAINPIELVYMHRTRTSDGYALVKMIWHEYGEKHTASFDMISAAGMGLDIGDGFILLAPWVMVNAVIEIALSERLGML